jgi:hypothetical protein
MHGETHRSDQRTGRQRADARRDEEAAAGSDGDDHEHHLESLEKHRLVSGKAGEPI